MNRKSIKGRATILCMKKYRVREPLSPKELASCASHSELIGRLLFHRGIRDAEAVEAFLEPDFEKHTHDPFLLADMERAVSRVLSAIQRNERIAVWSDYDADGIPGGVILHDFFKKIGFANFTNYIPHRHDEGFGLNRDGIEELAHEGASLIITVDCGTADHGEAALARELGVDLIITDHHEIPQGFALPDAYATINPKRPDCQYPEKMLCGAALAWKLVSALLTRLNSGSPSYRLQTKDYRLPPAGWEKWLLDLAGLATLSDMVPLRGENRVIAKYGLQVLRKTPRLGFRTLCAKLRINQQMLTEDDIVQMVHFIAALHAGETAIKGTRDGELTIAWDLLSLKIGRAH
ncbi:MAG: single-stranded-DNA-specific exonuclease, partial [Parcubacteria group bacterium Gr01-1014_72]